ncbi:MAG: hypothetical protein MJ223_02110 [Mycoplasmoidaceae bacterium]|nr:hypothetical protein [Mycoplasmoidaceae bacterium]
MYFVQNGHYGNIEYTAYFNFWDAFNCGNVTFTASRISSIVPGNNGPLEKLLNIFLVNLASFNVCIAATHDPAPLPEDTYNIIQVVSNNGIII